MFNDELKFVVVVNIKKLYEVGIKVVLVYGGGLFIKSILKMVGIEFEFIGGYCKMILEVLKYIEMVFKGEVNSSLVNLLNRIGLCVVGLFGKDGWMVIVVKCYYEVIENGQIECFDFGQVGDVIKVDIWFLEMLFL